MGSGSFEHRERRMTLIEVAHIGLYTEGHQEPPATNPKDQLLLQAQLGTASVEFGGDAAVRWNVRGIVRIEEIQFRSAYLDLPSADPKLAGRKVDC